MAQIVPLQVQARSGIGTSAVKKIRRAGWVPATYYGETAEPDSLQLRSKLLSDALHQSTSEHFLVHLELEGEAKPRLALLQEVQHHPLTGQLLHADFHAVSEGKEIHSTVPVIAKGEADGVKNFGGILEQHLRDIEIACLPTDLPELVEVDVSALGVGENLALNQVELPQGVRALTDADAVVFHISAPRLASSSEEEAGAGGEVKEPEVVGAKEKEAEESA